MLIEAVAALVVGIAILVLILEPLIRVEPVRVAMVDPEESEESARGQALTALREIEFDRATGKLSDVDYDSLKQRYTRVALDAIRAEDRTAAPPAAESGDLEAQIAARVVAIRRAGDGAMSCPACGPRPESDALFCSDCGRPLGLPGSCPRCHTAMTPGSRFCESCGQQVAA